MTGQVPALPATALVISWGTMPCPVDVEGKGSVATTSYVTLPTRQQWLLGWAPLRRGCSSSLRQTNGQLMSLWAGGRDAALDVTVFNPLHVATLAGAAATPSHTLTFAHNRKLRGAEDECRRQGIAFLPMAAESFGGWHPAAEREFRKLGAALSCHTGQEEDEAHRHLWGRLGVLLQRGNAALLRGQTNRRTCRLTEQIGTGVKFIEKLMICN